MGLTLGIDMGFEKFYKFKVKTLHIYMADDSSTGPWLQTEK